MITSFSCECGNTAPDHAQEYDGALGYEAIVCLDCARYYDHFGTHKPNEWSRDFVAQAKRKPLALNTSGSSPGR